MKAKRTIFEPLHFSAVLLIISGLVHIPIWLLDGTSWEGSISWRKPILFGISTGITLWSLAWVVSTLRTTAVDRTIGWIISVTLVVEVALITVQQWRGCASHFNQATEVDRWIDGFMLLLIVVAFVGILYFSLRVFDNLNLDRDYKFAARSGMLLLIASCIIGFVISFHGYQQVNKGLSPEKIGERGIAKFPHGVAIHALQILPMVVYALRLLNLDLIRRVRVVKLVFASFVLQLSFSIYQSFNGLARLDFSGITSQLFAIAILICMAMPLFLVLRDCCLPYTANPHRIGDFDR